MAWFTSLREQGQNCYHADHGGVGGRREGRGEGERGKKEREGGREEEEREREIGRKEERRREGKREGERGGRGRHRERMLRELWDGGMTGGTLIQYTFGDPGCSR